MKAQRLGGVQDPAVHPASAEIVLVQHEPHEVQARHQPRHPRPPRRPQVVGRVKEARSSGPQRRDEAASSGHQPADFVRRSIDGLRAAGPGEGAEGRRSAQGRERPNLEVLSLGGRKRRHRRGELSHVPTGPGVARRRVQRRQITSTSGGMGA